VHHPVAGEKGGFLKARKNTHCFPEGDRGARNNNEKKKSAGAKDAKPVVGGGIKSPSGKSGNGKGQKMAAETSPTRKKIY